MRKSILLCVFSILATLVVGCSQSSDNLTEIRHFPVDNLDGVLAGTSGQIDMATTSDGHGSLRIDCDKPTVIRLFEVDGLSIEDALLIYQARVRTQGITGKVYLEMWCDFPGLGEFFSRGLNSPITGNSDWTITSTPFILKKGQTPDKVKLNLVIDGSGTAWVDDIRLLRSPLS